MIEPEGGSEECSQEKPCKNGSSTDFTTALFGASALTGQNIKAPSFSFLPSAFFS